MNALKLEDYNWKNKTVAVRLDLNSDMVNGKIEGIERFQASLPTLRFLMQKKAKIVVLAHQGRKGDVDFVSLKQHSLLLQKLLKKPVQFSSQTIGEEALQKINGLKGGQVLVLENTRFLSDGNDKGTPQEMEQRSLPQFLLPLIDAVVQDAFSVCHRGMPDTIGLHSKPHVAGRLLQKELKGLKRISEFKKPFTVVLGGAKPAEALMLIQNLKQADAILTGGIVGELALIAKGIHLGAKEEWLKKEGIAEEKTIELTQALLSKFTIPIDLAIEKNQKRVEVSIEQLPVPELTFDVGSKTIASYKKIIQKSRTIYFKGPLGKFEDKRFEKGTKEILNAIASAKAFSFAGGGQSYHACKRFLKKKKLGYLSLSGGALEYYLGGEPLPVLQVLEHWSQKLGKTKSP